jgi:prephenate dehydrogenase
MSTDLLIVGTGLIGTSIGLALRDQADVALSDRDPATLAAAVGRGAGRPWDGTERFRLALVAAPPSAVAEVMTRLQQVCPDAVLGHVASVQEPVQSALTAAGVALDRVCGSHPMAGKEQSGPQAASADLFVGRPWVLCPSPATSAEALDAVRGLVQACGAEPVVLSAAEHDAAVALVSHLPQVAASAVAALLERSGARPAGAVPALELAGPGLQDTTRIAGSAPGLWVDLLRHNAAAVAPLVHDLVAELSSAAAALDRLAAQPGDAGAAAQVEGLISRGNVGRSLVPRKRGGHDRDFAVVSVAVPDRPGQLAGVLVSAAQTGVNVEDVRVEHLPGRPTGVIELLVQPAAQEHARQALRAAGWDVTGP